MKPSFFIWLLSAPVLTGILITVLLLLPAMAPKLGLWIAVASLVSAVITVPFSLAVGKAIQ
jgi:hypothetical protein